MSGLRSSRMQSLSVRLLLVAVIVMLITEIVVFLPGLAQERRAWLRQQIRDAHIVGLAVAAAPGGTVDPAIRAELLQLSRAEMIRLAGPGGTVVALETANAAEADVTIDLRQETIAQSVANGVKGLFEGGSRRLRIIGQSPLRPQTMVEVIVAGRRLSNAMWVFARAYATVSLVIAGVTGLLLYVALSVLIVRPMRRMTGSIAAFRAAPERAPADAPVRRKPGDEIGLAAQELTAMQTDLRQALWRNARLAALGTALAKVSHDLRGILSSAMLAADRLTMHADPAVKRSGEIVVRAVERATELVRQTLEFAREGPPPLTRVRFALAGLVAESAESVQGIELRNQVPDDLEAQADRVALFRVLTNLMRNAQQAGAHRVTVTAGPDPQGIGILVADDGPGLPEAMQDTLFRAFSGTAQSGGSGLGLAIARDLMRAHGGDVVLDTTGPEGTTFRLLLPSQ